MNDRRNASRDSDRNEPSRKDHDVVKVLVVDDSPDIVRLLRLTLTEQGYDVSVACCGQEALEIASAQHPDVVLLDVGMPGMDGIEVCRRLKADEGLRSIPVILLTARDLDEDVVMGLDSGADDYVAKPFSDEVLAARVRSAVRLKHSYDAVARANEELRREIAVRDQAQTALRASEHRYCQLLEAVTSYVYSVKLDHGVPVATVHSAGCLTATGYTPEEYAADLDLWFSMIHPDDREMISRHVTAMLAGKDAPPVEHRIIHKDGTVRWVRDTIVRHCTEAGTFDRYDGLVENITQRKLAEENLWKKEEQFRESQKLETVGLLAGGIAHEFNNLLQAISGYAACALEGLAPEDGRYQDLQHVLKAADRAAALTRQLLGFSRRQVLQPRQLDPNQLITDFAKMVGPIIGEHISLEVALNHEAGSLYADPGELQQVLLNLCINARDAMPAGGKLSLTVDTVLLSDAAWDPRFRIERGPHVVFSVADTGCGIPAEAQPRIFEPFFTTKEVGKGTGLGLAMVYGVVQQHNGAIRVYSEPGLGTTVKIYLPVRTAATEDDVHEPRRPAPGGLETILVAEDEPMVRALAVRILENAGYRVLAASDGAQALRMFAEDPEGISLMLLDAVMPALTGFEVYRRIKAEYPQARAIFASGYDPETSRSKFILQKNLRLIAKPYDAQTLLRAVREALDEEPTCQLAVPTTS